MPYTILRLPEVRSRTGLSRSSIYRLAAEGKFPAPLALSSHTSGWVESEIEAWVAERIARRDGTWEMA